MTVGETDVKATVCIAVGVTIVLTTLFLLLALTLQGAEELAGIPLVVLAFVPSAVFIPIGIRARLGICGETSIRDQWKPIKSTDLRHVLDENAVACRLSQYDAALVHSTQSFVVAVPPSISVRLRPTILRS